MPRQELQEHVFLDEFIEFHAQQLEGHAHVVAEGEVLQHVADVCGAVLVLVLKLLQDTDLLSDGRISPSIPSSGPSAGELCGPKL